MKPKALWIKEPKEKIVGYACGNCGTIYKEKEPAEECCKPLICEKCGREISQDKTLPFRECYYVNPIRCRSCYEKDKWDNMETLTEEEYLELCKKDNTFGPVVDGDTWAVDLYELLEELYNIYDEGEYPTEIQLGQFITIAPINIENILINNVENLMFEEAPSVNEVYNEVDKLVSYVNKWNKKQTYKYMERINKKVKLSEKTIKEYFGKEE